MRRNKHGCAPKGDRCEFHNEPLVNPKGCQHGDPQGGYAPLPLARPGIVVDVEVEGGQLTELLAQLPLQPAGELLKRSNDGKGEYFRLQLVFNRRGKIERATVLPFTAAYRRRVSE